MAKLQKQYYYSADGSKKINCYKVNIPRAVIDKLGFQDDQELEIKTGKDKIIIEKKEGQNEN